MLTRLELANFKCFELLKLPLTPLTMLSGANASGKSSVLQALVLLHQTIREQEWSKRLLLNGQELRLGTVTDVVDKVTGRRGFAIGLVDDDRTIRWSFQVDDRKDMSAAVHNVTIDDVVFDSPQDLQFLLPAASNRRIDDLTRRLARLSYLTAERVGPREVYALEDPNSTQVVGPKGESAVSVLHWGRDEKVLDDLVLAGSPPTRLRQVEAYMRQFFPGCSFEIQQVPLTNACTLGLRTSDATDFHRPIHVGFGLTQLFPILVAALSANRGDLLLIENPEVHLHPAGQAKIGSFLAKISAAGIQVIVETHSDHVLNGMRRAVKAQVVNCGDVALHFFRSRDGATDQVISPTMDQNGNLDIWPDGFFDQFDKDMNHFAGWGG